MFLRSGVISKMIFILLLYFYSSFHVQFIQFNLKLNRPLNVNSLRRNNMSFIREQEIARLNVSQCRCGVFVNFILYNGNALKIIMMALLTLLMSRGYYWTNQIHLIAKVPELVIVLKFYYFPKYSTRIVARGYDEAEHLSLSRTNFCANYI